MNNQQTIYDVIIIGAGPGGYVTAIRGAQLGLKVAIVEAEHLGGICLNWGCIPTKALLRSSEILEAAKNAEHYGLEIKSAKPNVEKIVARSRNISQKLNKGVGHLLKKNKVSVIMDRAKIHNKHEQGWSISLEKSGELVTAKKIILATGARARELPNFTADGKSIWTYKHALMPPKTPKDLLVMGSGAIGMEFACFYAQMGANVTVIEMQKQILPQEDEEISAEAEKSFKTKGINILTGTVASACNKTSDGVSVTLEKNDKKETIKVDTIISAVGIVGNVENLGLEKIGVKIDRGHIVTDGFGATNIAGIYAIGDVAGPPWLAHKAEHEGVGCIEKIANLATAHPMDTSRIPGCTYTHPQIASIGITEQAAKQQKLPIRIGKFPFIGNGKAMALGETNGFIKTIFCKNSGALLGAHMIGAEVTELIHAFSVAITLETTEEELMKTVFPHPTLSEALHESVLDAYDRAIHI